MSIINIYWGFFCFCYFLHDCCLYMKYMCIIMTNSISTLMSFASCCDEITCMSFYIVLLLICIIIYFSSVCFSSPEHKVLRANYCDSPLSVVRQCVRACVNFFNHTTSSLKPFNHKSSCLKLQGPELSYLLYSII